MLIPASVNWNQNVKAKILVVDDEPDVLDLVTYNLVQADFQVDTAADGAEALRKARSTKPNLILLDLMLPEMDGLEVCKLLRHDPKTRDIPIIMLTARAGEVDRVVGLELGATDYITKPFSPRELVLRVKKRLDERQAALEPKASIAYGPLQIDLSRHLVTVKGKRIELTATEFRLLSVLAQRMGHVQTRERLLRDVWEYETHIDTRTVDTHMRRLRDKLGPAAKYLDTVRGVGYRFFEEA
jgi:two-component system phosphate regulon response regulator PhoB